MDVDVAQEHQFFGFAIDISLISVAIVSSLVSLTVPCLYYLRKECREHPTVLIANISLLESVANFNVLLMAYGLYGYEGLVDVQQITKLLMFEVDLLQSDDTFCTYNYCVYMFLELLSMSFHICYSFDLLLTIKFPFLAGRKRRSYYYLFSLLFPLVTIVNSFEEASNICSDDLRMQSIFVVPLWFLVILIAFCGASLLIVAFSFCQKGQSAIREAYIKQHRTVLLLLVLLWLCPVWSNILIQLKMENADHFQLLNIISFFSLVSSSGIINLVRFGFDRGLRQKVWSMVCCKKRKKQKESSLSEEYYLELNSEDTVNDEAWNMPLAGALSSTQSQQLVHSLIQVVCEACSQSHQKEGRQSIFRGSVEGESLSQSLYRNTVVVQSDIESVDKSLMDLLLHRRQKKMENLNPNNCNLAELKFLCRKKRRFHMTCITKEEEQRSTGDERLRQKTVHITSTLSNLPNIQDKVHHLDINVTSYSHRVFVALRNNDGIDGDQLQKSLDLQKNVRNIKKAKESLGASGSFFFFSYDHKMIIKTISQEQKDRFIRLLPYYFQHIQCYPSSLLARTYGVFSVQIAGLAKIYFIMMENSFRQLEQNALSYNVYDLKGSTVQREVRDPQAKVRKDINYFKSPDCFIFLPSSQKKRLLEQAQLDTEMLQKHNIMDYSLLLGVAKSKARKKRGQGQRQQDEQEVEDWKYVKILEQSTRRIYSLSIIDYLQEFNFNKKMELWLKRIFKGGGDISSVGTDIYHDRFLKFLKRIVLVFRVKIHKQLQE